MGIQINVVASYPINDEMERVLGLAEAVGEPVTVTFRWKGGGKAERAVLVPAATLALWEHWVPTAYSTSDAGGENRAETEQPELAHPAKFGAFTLFRRRVGGRTAVARGCVVVAELLDPGEARWLQEKVRNVRESFMDPKQRAAFEEFLARQPPLTPKPVAASRTHSAAPLTRSPDVTAPQKWFQNLRRVLAQFLRSSHKT